MYHISVVVPMCSRPIPVSHFLCLMKGLRFVIATFQEIFLKISEKSKKYNRLRSIYSKQFKLF